MLDRHPNEYASTHTRRAPIITQSADDAGTREEDPIKFSHHLAGYHWIKDTIVLFVKHKREIHIQRESERVKESIKNADCRSTLTIVFADWSKHALPGSSQICVENLLYFYKNFQWIKVGGRCSASSCPYSCLLVSSSSSFFFYDMLQSCTDAVNTWESRHLEQGMPNS